MIWDDYDVCLSDGRCGCWWNAGNLFWFFFWESIACVCFFYFQKYIYERCAHLSLSVGKRYFHISSLYRRVTFPYSGMRIFTFHFLHSETFQRRTSNFHERFDDKNVNFIKNIIFNNIKIYILFEHQEIINLQIRMNYQFNLLKYIYSRYINNLFDLRWRQLGQFICVHSWQKTCIHY